MFKLGRPDGDGWVDYLHPRVYRVDPRDHGGSKITATAAAGDTAVFARLCACLEAPLIVLYVLHTPRGEGEPGRYQSQDIDHDELDMFLKRFAGFLAHDGRFDLWLYSPGQKATVVWDRHNFVHAYGSASCYETALRGLGYLNGVLPVLGEHMHFYHPEFDDDARDLLSAMDWYRTPLHPEDEQ